MKKRVKCIRRKAGLMMLAIYFTLQSSMTAYATGIGTSKIATGTTKLIQDASTWLLVLAPIVAGMLIIYFCIRRAAADEMDVKKWNNRIGAAIVSCIGAVLGSATLNVIIGYYR
ncbi:MAG: Mbov_0395 family pilin-like conjugal transfer protein [Lachnospiraceae bacterium]